MSITQFQKITRGLSYLLIFLSLTQLITLAMTLKNWTVINYGLSFQFHLSNLAIFSSQANDISKEDWQFASVLTHIPYSLAFSYLFWKGSTLFKKLSVGLTPFSYEFFHLFKLMGVILIIIDCFASILFSSLVSFAMSQGHFFQIQLTAVSLVGIIFVCLAEIVNYGIKLQKFSDHVI